MTGIEVAGLVLILGMVVGAIGGSTHENATKAKGCFVCVEMETSREKDVDKIVPPNLNADDMTLRPLPKPEFPNP